MIFSGKIGQQLFLVGPFGSFQGIKLLDVFLDIDLDMRCRGTFTAVPAHNRVRVNFTIFARRIFHCFAAPFALLYNHVTETAIKIAPSFGHEGTIRPDFDGLTYHVIHLLLINYGARVC